jgi:glycosyltransferase involved in cell wall biosynthesis
LTNLSLDATYSRGSNLSGVGVYSRELLRELAAQHPDRRFHWYYRPNKFFRRDALPANASPSLLFESLGSRSGLFHGLNQRLPKRRFPMQVVTFHDLFVLTAQYSTPEFRRRFAQQARHAAAQADLIVAVSQFTGTQVETLLGVEKSRIRVIHHGVAPAVLPPTPEPIILSVGAIQTRKNTARLVAAFARIPEPWKLVLAGSAGYGAQEILAGIAGNPRIAVTGYISQPELARWYSRASIFAFPSLDEGFGMPVLEAMAAGVPVIASQCSALPEVAGDAALLIDPQNTDELAHALSRLTQDEPERKRLSMAGRKRADLFTWRRAAQQTWAVWAELTSLPQPQSSALSGISDPAK